MSSSHPALYNLDPSSFVFTFMLTYGNQMSSYSTWTTTLMTLYRMCLGDWDYDSIYK